MCTFHVVEPQADVRNERSYQSVPLREDGAVKLRYRMECMPDEDCEIAGEQMEFKVRVSFPNMRWLSKQESFEIIVRDDAHEMLEGRKLGEIDLDLAKLLKDKDFMISNGLYFEMQAFGLRVSSFVKQGHLVFERQTEKEGDTVAPLVIPLAVVCLIIIGYKMISRGQVPHLHTD